MKIVLLDKDTLGSDIDLSIFEQFGLFKTFGTTNSTETIEHISDADIVITNKVIIDKDVMNNTKIKLICISATGTNNVDLEYAKIKNITVKNVAGYSTNSVTQHTFALLLHILEHTTHYTNYVRSGAWKKSPIFTNIDKPFMEIANKNWGIIGLGNIGEKVATIAQSFGANVSYYSTSGTNHNTTYNATTLDILLKESDIITIHCPLNEKTKDLLNYHNMLKLKDNAIIINVARGGIINEYDICKIVKEKAVTFGLDTVSKEPIEEKNPLNDLLKTEQLYITPHIAWASQESRKKLIELVALNIKEFIKGEN